MTLIFSFGEFSNESERESATSSRSISYRKLSHNNCSADNRVERAIISANVQSPTAKSHENSDNLGRGKFHENATYDGRVEVSFIDDKSILNLHNHSLVAGGGRIFDNFCIGRGKLENVRRQDR